MAIVLGRKYLSQIIGAHNGLAVVRLIDPCGEQEYAPKMIASAHDGKLVVLGRPCANSISIGTKYMGVIIGAHDGKPVVHISCAPCEPEEPSVTAPCCPDIDIPLTLNMTDPYGTRVMNWVENPNSPGTGFWQTDCFSPKQVPMMTLNTYPGAEVPCSCELRDYPIAFFLGCVNINGNHKWVLYWTIVAGGIFSNYCCGDSLTWHFRMTYSYSSAPGSVIVHQVPCSDPRYSQFGAGGLPSRGVQPHSFDCENLTWVFKPDQLSAYTSGPGGTTTEWVYDPANTVVISS